jgi:hypothetical protein
MNTTTHTRSTPNSDTSKDRFSAKRFDLRKLLGCAAMVAVFSIQARGCDIFTLADGNTSAQLDLGTQAGISGWSVDGEKQMDQQGFWFRIGDKHGEKPLDSISSPSVTQTGPGTVSATYQNNQVSVLVAYTLTGGTPGTKASISEQVQIRNLTPRALDFHLFQYSDLDMSGPVQLGRDVNGFYNEAFVADNGYTLTAALESAVAPGANHGLAGVDTCALLNDLLPTTLVDSTGPATNACWTWEWDSKISGRGSWTLTQVMTLTAVPEPSIAAVGLLGLLVMAKVLGRRTVGLS